MKFKEVEGILKANWIRAHALTHPQMAHLLDRYIKGSQEPN